jgi:hypothetical protein
LVGFAWIVELHACFLFFFSSGLDFREVTCVGLWPLRFFTLSLRVITEFGRFGFVSCILWVLSLFRVCLWSTPYKKYRLFYQIISTHMFGCVQLHIIRVKMPATQISLPHTIYSVQLGLIGYVSFATEFIESYRAVMRQQ